MSPFTDKKKWPYNFLCVAQLFLFILFIKYHEDGDVKDEIALIFSFCTIGVPSCLVPSCLIEYETSSACTLSLHTDSFLFAEGLQIVFVCLFSDNSW